ncbi:MAG: PAS domain S-box protein [Chloroflexota bacterium]|nr:PAS domain S-box protein [Chloroflexota bacterium]
MMLKIFNEGFTKAKQLIEEGLIAAKAILQNLSGAERVTQILQQSEEQYNILYAAAQRQTQELALLDQIRTSLAQELELPAIFRMVVESIAHTFGYNQVCLYLLQDKMLELQYQIGYSHIITHIPITQGITGRVARTGEAVLLEDVRTDPDFLTYPENLGAVEDIVSEIYVPIFDQNQVIGVLNIGSIHEVKLSMADLRLMTALSENISLTVGRARLYAQARESEERYRRLTEVAIEGVAIIENGKIRDATQALANMFGYELPELIGKAASTLIAPNSVEQVIKSIFVGDEELYESKGLKKDGAVFPVEVCGKLIHYRGRLARVSAFRDLTERKRKEAELSQSEARLRALLSAIPDAMFRISHNGTFIDYKPARHAGITAPLGEVTGKTLAELLPPKIAQHYFYYLEQALQTGENQLFEYQTLLDGNQCDLEVRLVVSGEGEVLAIVRDITERKEVERLKNEFISTVSHELRTPLTSIRGSLGLIIGGIAGEIPPQTRTMVDIAYKNSERLVRLINDILDIEKIESGKMVFNLKPLPLLELLELSLEANRGYATQYGVQLSLDLNQTIPTDLYVEADSDRLIQVLTNLLSNAIKFSPTGDKVVLSVTVNSSNQRSPEKVRIAVTDYGSGIPEEFRSRIFQKFAQADSSDSRLKGGTGLGLSISKAIVEKHGGQLGFEPTPGGRGTTFYFNLPLWYEQVVEPKKEDTDDQGQELPTILICDDNPDIATLLSMFLKESGFKSDIAHSADEAKQLLLKGNYAALTLDLMLAGQDGVSLIRELRLNEATRHLPIVVVSASAEAERQQLNGNALAVIDWIDKPIDQVRLSAAVKRAVKVPIQTATADSGEVSARPHILHVEDDPDMRQVVQLVLYPLAEVSSVASLAEARQQLALQDFDLVLLDLELADGSGLDLLPELGGGDTFPYHYPHPQRSIPVVIFSAQEGNPAVAAQQVAAALVKTRTSNQELTDTITALIKNSAKK